MKKIPKRVRIVDNAGHEDYDRYIGTEANVLNTTIEDGILMLELDIPAMENPELNTSWTHAEVDIIQWQEVPQSQQESLIDLVNDLSRLINRDEYDVDVANEIVGQIRDGVSGLLDDATRLGKEVY